MGTFQLVKGISRNLQGASKSVDMLDWMGRAALEIIGQAGMGHSFDPLTSESSSDPYTKAAKTYLCVCSASVLSPLSFAHVCPGPCRSPLRWWL